jgi:uncharacterized protein YeeX (DUF496 family)
MSTLEEVKSLQSQGKQETEILQVLKGRGVPEKEITEAISQSKIKEAVSSDNGYSENSSSESQDPPTVVQEVQGMEPSMMGAEDIDGVQEEYSTEEPSQLDQYQDQYAPQYDQGYQDYQAPPQGLSSDTITEIAEQVVSENLSSLRTQVKKSINSQNTIETKIEILDERLKRIEKIIDKLQLSILERVGDYVSDVSDLKKEIIETQKSFKALNPHKSHTKTTHKKH